MHKLSYRRTTVEGTMRSLHILIINGEKIETTRKSELLPWAKPRINSKIEWRELKDAIRLERSFDAAGG